MGMKIERSEHGDMFTNTTNQESFRWRKVSGNTRECERIILDDQKTS